MVLTNIQPAQAYETTEYLIFGSEFHGFVYYGIEMEIGDNLTWSFKTYSEEFEVQCRIGDICLSEGLTSDFGVWYAPDSETYYITFINFDILLFRDGFIDIYFEVNVEPEPEPAGPSEPDPAIPSFNLIIIIGIIGIIGFIITKKIKSKN